MSDKLFYPAVFRTAEEGGFWITFPDFSDCLTQGENMEEAYKMAVDALGLAISDKLQSKEQLPAPSSLEDIAVDARSGSFLAIIEFDKLAYNKKHNSKAIKKTLSIPEWLNQEAMALGVNFSQALQEALMQKISK